MNNSEKTVYIELNKNKGFDNPFILIIITSIMLTILYKLRMAVHESLLTGDADSLNKIFISLLIFNAIAIIGFIITLIKYHKKIITAPPVSMEIHSDYLKIKYINNLYRKIEFCKIKDFTLSIYKTPKKNSTLSSINSISSISIYGMSPVKFQVSDNFKYIKTMMLLKDKIPNFNYQIEDTEFKKVFEKYEQTGILENHNL